MRCLKPSITLRVLGCCPPWEKKEAPVSRASFAGSCPCTQIFRATSKFRFLPMHTDISNNLNLKLKTSFHIGVSSLTHGHSCYEESALQRLKSSDSLDTSKDCKMVPSLSPGSTFNWARVSCLQKICPSSVLDFQRGKRRGDLTSQSCTAANRKNIGILLACPVQVVQEIRQRWTRVLGETATIETLLRSDESWAKLNQMWGEERFRVHMHGMCQQMRGQRSVHAVRNRDV